MSNPGVIELFGLQFRNNSGVHSFRVEDNIGEAIHFHFDNLRLDLTVDEFRTFADDMLDAINGMVDAPGFDAKKCDPLFLFEVAEYLPLLREVKIEYIPVADIIVDTVDKNGNTVYRNIKHSRIVKALRGDYAENDKHQQRNLLGQNNRHRLLSMFNSVKNNGYPLKASYSVGGGDILSSSIIKT